MGHRLQSNGNRSVSIGKLHYRSTEDSNGFDEEIMPLHVVDGTGDLLGLIRDDLPVRKAALKLAEEAGPGDSSYQRYDERITASAQEWLTHRATERGGKPWVLFVSLVCPHFPLKSRDDWYRLYPEADVPWPNLYAESERPSHPYVAAIRECMIYDKAFTERKVRRAIAAYFGMVSSWTIMSARSCRRWIGPADGRHAGDLHQRPRRQPRVRAPVGQIDNV